MKIWTLKNLRKSLKYFVLLPPNQQLLELQICIFHEFLSSGQEIFHQVSVKWTLLKILFTEKLWNYILECTESSQCVKGEICKVGLCITSKYPWTSRNSCVIHFIMFQIAIKIQTVDLEKLVTVVIAEKVKLQDLY